MVYTAQGTRGTVDSIDFDLGEALADMDDDNRTIVVRLLEIYEALVSQNEAEEGEPVTAYKSIDIEALPNVLDRTAWEGSATQIAGRLASNLILTHPLPNANHRTAVALVQFYLRRFDASFMLPETVTGTEEWHAWVDEYITDSKRLLTVRRNNVLFKHLRRFGTTTVERKHGVEIDLPDYELDMYPSEAKQIYATEHEHLWITFVEDAVERAEKPELRDAPGLSKAAFADAIRDLR
ncbi:hypothetical protein [Halomicrobium zhouii]|uniref:hypothetical protein n=1 Tax=Halomicrobium zhouii TaxID=767519 RepID=UPI000B7DC860|nr:hypothetical protein [Halomicrobium zhouii]